MCCLLCGAGWGGDELCKPDFWRLQLVLARQQSSFARLPMLWVTPCHKQLGLVCLLCEPLQLIGNEQM